MIKYFLIPTWLIYLVLKRMFPKKHVWYDRNFSLEQWSTGATLFTLFVSLVLWLDCVGLLILQI